MAQQMVDVVVIGAGVAGLACAQGLVRQGKSVVLFERLNPMPDCLKAEKIDAEAVQALLRLGFAAAVAETLTPLDSVAVYFGERSLGTIRFQIPEAGGYYHELINSMRRHLDPRVQFRPLTKATAFEHAPDGVDVVTDKGERVSCRYVVLASGDARQLIESLGGVYAPEAPHLVYAVAFTMEGTLMAAGRPVSSLTYHHPIAHGPIVYATVFRLGSAIRANVYSTGEVADEWRRNLKQRPLEILREHNHAFAAASGAWRITSPVITRIVHVAKMQAPVVSRIVVLGDAAHTIDPAGGGGMLFGLLEVELLLEFYLSRWLAENPAGAEAMREFYQDPRRMAAVDFFFQRGQYIYALNNDASLKGHLRRLRFAFGQATAARRPAPQPPPAPTQPWQVPTGLLFERYAPVKS